MPLRLGARGLVSGHVLQKQTRRRITGRATMARGSSEVSWVVRAVDSGLTLPGSRSEPSFMRVRPGGLKVNPPLQKNKLIYM